MQIKELTTYVNGFSCHLKIPEVDAKRMDLEWQKYGEREDFFPYWLSTWNAAFAFFAYHQQKKLSFKGPILELGCGNGTLAQILPQYQKQTIYSDIVFDAVSHTFQNCQDQAQALVMDLRHSCLRKEFQTMIATELSYEDHLVDALLEITSTHLQSGGQAFFCETVKAGRGGNEGRIRRAWTGGIHIETFEFTRDEQVLEAKIFVLEKL